MLNILLIEDDPSLTDRLTFILEGISGVNISTASSYEDALRVIREDQEINLIVSDCRNKPKDKFDEFIKYAVYINCLLCMEDPDQAQETVGWKIIAKIKRSEVANGIKKAIETIKQSAEYVEKMRYCRIKTSLLLETTPLQSDIYAKLTDTKYLKVLLKGDSFDSNDFIRFTEKKKMDYLYLREDGCKDFVNHYVSAIDSLIKENKNPGHDQIHTMNRQNYESVQNLTQTFGYNRDVQKLAKTHVGMTVHFMERKPDLSHLLERLKAKRGKYQADHAFLLSHISCAIAAAMDYVSDSTFFKLTMAAFLHDIAINDDALAACATIEEAKNLGLDETKIDAFKNHPKVAANFIRKMRDLPSGIDDIIEQHHELPNGQGFPAGLGSQSISPLASIFIVAHDMVGEIFSSPGQELNILEYCERSQEKFTGTNFKKILMTVKKMN